MKRREFIKLSSLLGASAVTSPAFLLGGCAAKPLPGTGQVTATPTICDMCFWKCAGNVYKEDDELWKITGNDDDLHSGGRLCTPLYPGFFEAFVLLLQDLQATLQLGTALFELIELVKHVFHTLELGFVFAGADGGRMQRVALLDLASHSIAVSSLAAPAFDAPVPAEQLPRTVAGPLGQLRRLDGPAPLRP